MFPLTMRWVNLETGEVVDCTEPDGLDQKQACIERIPAVPVPSVPSGDTSDIVGWQARTVYENTIQESCGRFRAQDGYYNCEIFFSGTRKVITVGTIYCGCSDPQYTTTGTIHNYDIEADIMHWGSYKNSASVGGGAETCWDFTFKDPWTYGVTGSIYKNDADDNDSCYSRLVDVKGTWGISVEYKRTVDDKDKQSFDKPVRADAKARGTGGIE
jgi:hypothetical protein